MLRKPLFILAHEVGNRSFFPTYKNIRQSQWLPYAELKRAQEKQLRALIDFSYEQVPYYRSLFKELHLHPKDIRKIEDLEKLPLLTKETIKARWEEFKPTTLSSMKFDSIATGGSTGTPLQYRLSSDDRFLGAALLYRGWGYGGYNLGDRMVMVAGTSLDINTKTRVVTRAHEIARNMRKFSSFDMGESEMRQYAATLSSFSPRFIRGYASSIYFFARWLEGNDIDVPPVDAVFTTAEKLMPHMRKTIGEMFGCDVYDNYGLQDGGVSAYECSEHSGLHIDTERSIMEVVDSSAHQVVNGEGLILATSLHNYSMPFIRYSTGDIGFLSDKECACGRHHLILDNIVAREKEYLVTPTCRVIHGAAFIGLIFILLESSAFPDTVNQIRQYQIIQRSKEALEIRLVCDEPLPDEVLEYIQNLVSERFDGWRMEFEYVDAIDQTGAGKFKFIINEMGII